ncbi:MAG: high-potential iron-sulfur protein [Vulcanimicrobiaceae bacterium]
MAAIPLGALAVAASLSAAPAADPRTQFKYQTHPGKNGQQCSGCLLFKPGKDAASNGSCQIVPGSISPHGWCVNFAPKPK